MSKAKLAAPESTPKRLVQTETRLIPGERLVSPEAEWRKPSDKKGRYLNDGPGATPKFHPETEDTLGALVANFHYDRETRRAEPGPLPTLTVEQQLATNDFLTWQRNNPDIATNPEAVAELRNGIQVLGQQIASGKRQPMTGKEILDTVTAAARQVWNVSAPANPDEWYLNQHIQFLEQQKARKL